MQVTFVTKHENFRFVHQRTFLMAVTVLLDIFPGTEAAAK